MGKQRRATKFQRIRGVVSATEWDDDDRVVAVVLTTDDDDELLISPAGRGEALLEYVGEYVEVKGVVQDEDGDYGLVVRNFKVLSQAEGEEEEEEGIFRGHDDDFGDDLDDPIPAPSPDAEADIEADIEAEPEPEEDNEDKVD